MIYEALSCLTEDMNEYFRNKLKITEDKVVLSGLVNQEGSSAIQGENKIVVTLVNIERETAHQVGGKGLSSTMSTTSPAIYLNMYILFSSYFSNNNYPEALRFLAFTIGYIQHKNVFTKSNTPSLNEKIDKLTFEMTDLNADKLSNMWAALGAKYMPSVLYKVRMLTIDESVVREYRPVVSSLDNDTTPKAD